MIIKKCKVPPTIRFSKSYVIGCGGMHYYGSIIVATDFPLWFTLYILLHEFIHYLNYFLPFTSLIAKIFSYNEVMAKELINFLSPISKQRIISNPLKLINYLRCIGEL